MGVTIDIDIGGTFTDCFVVFGDNIVREKTPTTTYDLSVGFRKAINAVARRLDVSVEELLETTAPIRYSTTIAMNTLIQRTGTKLGLITTAGHEHVLYIGRSKQWADGLHPRERRYMYLARKPELLIPLDMTVGVAERIDCFGEVILPISREDVRECVHHLVNKGARGFVVSLLWSFLNPVHEQIVREVIKEEYPDPFLGNMPILLSSEIQPRWHEYPRTNVTVLSGYLHTELTEQLSSLGEDLRARGYKKPLNIINNVGGMAKISRTSAVDTFGAGPVAGLMGAAYLSKTYGLPKVVATDMGGTSFDYGLVLDGKPCFYHDWPVIDRWATERSMIELRTIGAGGGSVAWLNNQMGNMIEVGPNSAGANPGPACYDLGGKDPTVTDADVVLGYINPDYFLGGAIKLSKEQAIKSMDKIAKPLGIPPEEAASAIRKVVDGNMGSALFYELSMRGYAPNDFTMFAYGGGGPTHCAGYNSYLGTPRVLIVPSASVFCAHGGSTMDLKHGYETSRHISLYNSSRGYLSDFEQFKQVVVRLEELAFRDLKAEGFQPEDIILTLELDIRYGAGLVPTRLLSPRLHVSSTEDVKAICDAFYVAFSNRYTALAASPETGVNVENFYLFATVRMPKPKLPVFEPAGEIPDLALKGVRPVYWEYYESFRETNIYDAELLRPRNAICGPAVVEAGDTTIVISPGMKYGLDQHLTGTIEKY